MENKELSKPSSNWSRADLDDTDKKNEVGVNHSRPIKGEEEETTHQKSNRKINLDNEEDGRSLLNKKAENYLKNPSPEDRGE